MSDHWILIFAYHFPPENAIGGFRPFRFYKYLLKRGYKCHVITAADVSGSSELDADYVADPFPNGSQRSAGWQCERLIRKLLLPGVAGTQWSSHAYQAGLHFIQQRPECRFTLLATFPPLGPLLAAWRLARKLNLPWIADFRDPLPGSALHSARHTRALYGQLERLFVNSANEVIANTDEAQRILQQNYPKRAHFIHLIWNGFDPEQRITPLPSGSSTTKVLTHTGELYEGRTVAPVLESISRLIASGRVAPGAVQVQLIGPAAPQCLPDKRLLNAAESSGWLRIIPQQMPVTEAQRLARTSDFLLLIQPHTKIQVPGKLFEYIQIGRPILAFVVPDSPIERILSRSGVAYKCVFAASSPDAIDSAVYEFLQSDSTPRKPSEWFEQTFNAESQTAMLSSLFEKLNLNGQRK